MNAGAYTLIHTRMHTL